MRLLQAMILIAALMPVAAAQRAQNNTDEQLKARNAPDTFVAGISSFGPDKKGRTTFSIEVQNLGSKIIRAIDWEYAPSPPVGRYDAVNPLRFRNDNVKIRPDEKKKLSGQFDQYVQELITGYRLNNVRIMRVEYEDGSFWQRTADREK